MKLESLIDKLGARFIFVNVIPMIVLMLVALALHWSAVKGVGNIISEFRALEFKELLFLALVLVCLAFVIQPLQLPLIRLLEGYWGSGILGGPLSAWCIAIHKKRRAELKKAQTGEGLALSSNPSEAKMHMAASKLYRLYPREDRILPTTLGNVMRAAEDMPFERYGLNVAVVWPRLYPLLPKEMTSILADQRNQLDIAVRFYLVFLLIIPISAYFFWARWLWLSILIATSAAMAFASYRAAIAAALAYGQGINTAIDLYRFDLLTSLRLPLPADRDSEIANNERLSRFWAQGFPANFIYTPKEEKSSKD